MAIEGPTFIEGPVDYERLCRAALEALLPKPDPAKDLVEEWYSTKHFLNWVSTGDGTQRPEEGLADFLIQSGKIEVKR